MPAYDPPLSIWPGIIALAVGVLMLTYLIIRIVRDYRRSRVQPDIAQASPMDSKSTTNEPVP